MSINELNVEVSEVRRLQQEVEARKEKLATTLNPYITAYFSGLVATTRDSEKRREYATFIASKKFDILEDGDLVFTSSYYGNSVTHKVKLAELIQEA